MRIPIEAWRARHEKCKLRIVMIPGRSGNPGGVRLPEDRRQSSGNAFYVMTYSEVDFEGRGKRKRKTPTRYEGTIEVVVVENGAVEMEKRGKDKDNEDATKSGIKRVRRSTNNMTSEVEKQEAEKSEVEQDEVKSVKSRG